MDEDPPQVVSTDPPPGVTDWEGGVVRITFDEYVQVKNVREQWLISPPLDGLPAYRLRGRTLELDWSDVALPPDATVVLDLGASVTDLHEGNPLRQGVWAAATGPRLDSLRWSGQIHSRDFAAPAPNIRVMLFPESWPLDSLLAGARPRYVGMSGEDGRFAVGYIAPGRYRTWAVEDANKDWAWQPGEAVAWGPIWQAGDTLPTAMTLFPTARPEPVRAERATADSSGLAVLAWHGPESTQHLHWSTPSGDTLSWWHDGDSAYVWSPQGAPLPDTLLWTYQTDAASPSTDTVPSRTRPARRSATPRTLPTGKHPAASTATLRYHLPIAALNPSAWRLAADSTPLSPDSLTQPSPFEVALHFPEAPATKYRLTIPPEGLTLLGGTPTDTVETQWSTWPADHLAELVIAAYGTPVNGRLRLEDAAGRTLAQRPLAAGDSISWTLRELLPGKVELIWESDRWDTGTFEEADPEAERWGDVRLKAAGGVELRSNWTLEWIWPIECGKFPKLQG